MSMVRQTVRRHKLLRNEAKGLSILMVRQMVRYIYIWSPKAGFADGSRNGPPRSNKGFLVCTGPIIKSYSHGFLTNRHMFVIFL